MSPTNSELHILKMKSQLVNEPYWEIRQGIKSAVLQTGFSFLPRTGFNYPLEGEPPSLTETLDELADRLNYKIEFQIDWDRFAAYEDIRDQSNEIASQSCEIAKTLLREFSEEQLDIDAIPF